MWAQLLQSGHSNLKDPWMKTTVNKKLPAATELLESACSAPSHGTVAATSTIFQHISVTPAQHHTKTSPSCPRKSCHRWTSCRHGHKVIPIKHHETHMRDLPDGLACGSLTGLQAKRRDQARRHSSDSLSRPWPGRLLPREFSGTLSRRTCGFGAKIETT